MELQNQDPHLEKLDRKTDSEWRRLSNQVLYFRSQKKSCHTNQRLHSLASYEPQSPVSPLLHLWRSDNFSKDRRFADAVKSYDQAIMASQSARKFLHKQDIITGALTHKAQALVLHGDLSGAMGSYRDLILHQPSNKGAVLQAGIIAERLGNDSLAAEYYQRIASAEYSKRTDDPAQLAKRSMDRLNSSSAIYHSSAEELAGTLKRAIEKKNTQQLTAMISKTHFAIGIVGAHTMFEELELIDIFMQDLLLGRVNTDFAMLGSGEKMYMPMTGFKGKSFRGNISLMITKSPRGWQWSGMALHSPTKYWKERWQTEVVPRSGDIPIALLDSDGSVPFEILAPWPKPKCFMAGGLGEFLADETIVVAGGLFGFLVATAFAFKNCCGYGPRGYYYNTAPTHDEDESFAIDFTRYKERVPYVNEAGGEHVLAVAAGVVGPCEAGIESGNSSHPNFVTMLHDDPANPGDPSKKFVSRYLHLEGPFTLNVSQGMTIRVGTLLGFMDDTGNSAMDHLHFSIHSPGGPSIRPSPMSGITLGDDESGKCVKSNNFEHQGTLSMLFPTNYVSQNWLIAPSGIPVNQATPASITDQQFTLIVTGVAILDFKGADGDWFRDTILLRPDTLSALSYAVNKYRFPVPADGLFTPQFEVDQYALHATLSSIYNHDDSVNAGYAVDNWQKHPFKTDTDIFTNAQLTNLFDGLEVDIAVSDSDGHILRLSYHITLLGKIRIGQPFRIL